jgi:tRNA pseudouridine-54 N-methylase
MSKNNPQAWNTKYGPRRVRHEAPTLEEAIVAAQGLTGELDEQAEIAASLIGLPVDQVRAELLKSAPLRKDIVKSVVFTGSPSAPRTVVVERKPTRRIASSNRTGMLASAR